MTINERLNQIISELYKNNKRAFSMQIDVTPTVIENVVGKRQGKPSFDVLEKICAKANISGTWLLTGEGSMLKIDSPPEQSENNTETPTEGSIDTPLVAQLRAIIQEQARQIAHLEIELANERASVAANQMSTLSGES